MSSNGKIHSPVTHVALYAMLLVFTPFIMLQNYLQRAIGSLSEFAVEPFGVRLPLMFTIAVIVFAVALIVVRKRITIYRTIAFLACLLMIGVSQRICDFYMGNPFYDLQNNWHYIAYAGFALLMFRMLRERGKSAAAVVKITYISALLLSAFDEGFQFFLSSRVFDIGDIAKDGWGVLIGLIVVFFVIDSGRTITRKGWDFRRKKLADYPKSALSMLALAMIFNFLLISFGSVLTDLEYIWHALAFTSGAFIIVFAMIHLTKFKAVRFGLGAILLLAISAQTVSFLRYRSDNIVYNARGLTVYRGIPIPFFDVMIFPNGRFRLVDKKRYFNPGDKTTIFEQKADIVIIATGADGSGGLGFEKNESQFVYNKFTKRCSQAIPMRTPEACELFNRLKKEGKDVLFIINNT